MRTHFAPQHTTAATREDKMTQNILDHTQSSTTTGKNEEYDKRTTGSEPLTNRTPTTTENACKNHIYTLRSFK